jgi:hypothetical protein
LVQIEVNELLEGIEAKEEGDRTMAEITATINLALGDPTGQALFDAISIIGEAGVKLVEQMLASYEAAVQLALGFSAALAPATLPGAPDANGNTTEVAIGEALGLDFAPTGDALKNIKEALKQGKRVATNKAASGGGGSPQYLRSELGARVGGSLANAISAVADANSEFKLAADQYEKNAARIAAFQAANEYADALRKFASNAYLLSRDTTNPLTQAEADLRLAKQALTEDTKRFQSGGISKAERDVLQTRELDVRTAESRRDQTKFDQNLNAQQTAFDLGRITTAQYLKFLDGQRDNLAKQIKGMKKNSEGLFQAQQNLDQIDRLLKQVEGQFNGQFNLGDIQLPSEYQVRAAARFGTTGLIGANAVNQATSTTTTTQININGADTSTVLAILRQYLGGGNIAVNGL